MYRIFYFIFLTTASAGYCQKYDRFKENLVKINIDFKVPAGYIRQDSNIHYTWCWDNKISNGFIGTFLKSDSSVLIGIAVSPPSSEAGLYKIREYIPNWNSEMNYFNTFRNLADTVNSNVLIYGQKYLKENFNADRGVLFSRACTRIYNEKYKHNKVAIIGKVNSGFFEISYLFTDSATAIIDEEINKTLRMLRFKDKD